MQNKNKRRLPHRIEGRLGVLLNWSCGDGVLLHVTILASTEPNIKERPCKTLHKKQEQNGDGNLSICSQSLRPANTAKPLRVTLA